MATPVSEQTSWEPELQWDVGRDSFHFRWRGSM